VTGDEDGMVRLGWSIPQVGHLCGAVVVCGCGAGGGPRVGQSCACLSAIWTPPIRCHHTPQQTKRIGDPFPARRRGILLPNQTHRIHLPSIPLGGPVLSLLAGGDHKPRWPRSPRCRAARWPTKPCCLAASLPASRFAAPLVQPGVPVRCGAATRVARRSHSPRVAASSNGQPLF